MKMNLSILLFFDRHPFLRQFLKKCKYSFSLLGGSKGEIKKLAKSLNELRDLILMYQTRNLQQIHANPLNAFGCKCFSQTDEDGITLEIVRRLQIDKGTFVECGVGDGLENNTLILVALGWKGVWIGAEDLVVSMKSGARVHYLKSWIKLDNIIELINSGMVHQNMTTIDVLSMDLDGGDIYFIEKILSQQITPKLFIVEYNAQFPPPVKFKVSYKDDFKWNYNNYFGAALQNFYDLFLRYGYTLVCCNSHTGSNAFFVRNDYMHLFKDVPTDISKLFVSPRYFLYNTIAPQSRQVVQTILDSNE